MTEEYKIRVIIDAPFGKVDTVYDFRTEEKFNANSSKLRDAFKSIMKLKKEHDEIMSELEKE